MSARMADSAPRRGLGNLLLGALALAALLAWPMLVENVFYQRIGALVMLSALSASATWSRRG